jgi:PhzF family phenazine biosynthesis protein
MNIEVNIIQAFSKDDKGGNPAGVVFNADKLTTATKQLIATNAGFPETAFVSASSAADYKLEFFTPVKQIPHCGHATIATFSYLKKTGKIKADLSSKETIDGVRSILFRNDQAFMEQKAPAIINPTGEMDKILSSLNITGHELQPELLPTIVNTGNSFLIIPVKDESVLQRITYNRDEVLRISEKYCLIGFYLFAFTENKTSDATTRMFAPFYGIDEESATGMAAGPLAAFLYMKVGMKKTSILIEQGRFIKPASPSLLYVDLILDEEKNITQIFAGGSAYLAGSVEISLPFQD